MFHTIVKNEPKSDNGVLKSAAISEWGVFYAPAPPPVGVGGQARLASGQGVTPIQTRQGGVIDRVRDRGGC